MVAYGDRRGPVVGRDVDLHVPGLGVVDGVGDEVAHDPLHPPGVGLGMKPEPKFLQAGDVVTLGIDGLGEQRQKVVKFKM